MIGDHDNKIRAELRAEIERLKSIIGSLVVEWQPDEGLYSVSDRYTDGRDLELIRKIIQQDIDRQEVLIKEPVASKGE